MGRVRPNTRHLFPVQSLEGVCLKEISDASVSRARLRTPSSDACESQLEARTNQALVWSGQTADQDATVPQPHSAQASQSSTTASKFRVSRQRNDANLIMKSCDHVCVHAIKLPSPHARPFCDLLHHCFSIIYNYLVVSCSKRRFLASSRLSRNLCFRQFLSREPHTNRRGAAIVGSTQTLHAVRGRI